MLCGAGTAAANPQLFRQHSLWRRLNSTAFGSGTCLRLYMRKKWGGESESRSRSRFRPSASVGCSLSGTASTACSRGFGGFLTQLLYDGNAMPSFALFLPAEPPMTVFCLCSVVCGSPLSVCLSVRLARPIPCCASPSWARRSPAANPSSHHTPHTSDHPVGLPPTTPRRGSRCIPSGKPEK